MTPLAETRKARLPRDSVASLELPAIGRKSDASGSLGVKETASANSGKVARRSGERAADAFVRDGRDRTVLLLITCAAGQSWQQQHLADSSSLEGGVGLGGVLQRESPIYRNDEFAGGHRVGHVKKSIGVLL
jgi:hypothetical protein